MFQAFRRGVNKMCVEFSYFIKAGYEGLGVITKSRSVSRGGCLVVFHKKDALKNFAKFTGKHVCRNLF